MLKRFKAALPIVALFALGACTAGGDDPGLEYAPQMYHSVPYEPLTQIKDKDAGSWLSNREDGLGEFYNSNPNNAFEQNVRQPVAGTVRRTANGMLPYRLKQEDMEAAAQVPNPLPDSPALLAEGQRLYEIYCDHCHGSQGQGSGQDNSDGKVGEVFAGVPAYNSAAKKNLSQGHVFYVMTHGFGRMKSHASQISEEKRWKIAKYVQQLQNQ